MRLEPAGLEPAPILFTTRSRRFALDRQNDRAVAKQKVGHPGRSGESSGCQVITTRDMGGIVERDGSQRNSRATDVAGRARRRVRLVPARQPATSKPSAPVVPAKTGAAYGRPERPVGATPPRRLSPSRPIAALILRQRRRLRVPAQLERARPAFASPYAAQGSAGPSSRNRRSLWRPRRWRPGADQGACRPSAPFSSGSRRILITRSTLREADRWAGGPSAVNRTERENSNQGPDQPRVILDHGRIPPAQSR